MPATEAPEWRISNLALFKIVATTVLCFALVQLLPLLMLILLAILLACALEPGIRRLERFLPHWAASLSVTAAVILLMTGVVLGILPALAAQFSAVAKQLPESQTALLKNIHPASVREFVRRLLQTPTISSTNVLAAGQAILGTASEFVLMVVLALYLAADGKRTYAWLRAFFSPDHRQKIDETARESAEIVMAYVIGQFITSVLCGAYVFIVLRALEVPAALVLAVVAAVFDILPMIGFFLFTVPAVLFALTVSSKTALTVLALYACYHFLENYLLVPKIYGNRLRLSDLVVLTSVLGGALVAGVPGAILALPLVAVYPAVERIWLVKYIGGEVVERHDVVESSAPK